MNTAKNKLRWPEAWSFSPNGIGPQMGWFLVLKSPYLVNHFPLEAAAPAWGGGSHEHESVFLQFPYQERGTPDGLLKIGRAFS